MAMPRELFIGIMSGTSLEHPFPSDLRLALAELIESGKSDSVGDIGTLHSYLGDTYAIAVHELLQQTEFSAADIAAIGCHGQTICHEPGGPRPFTWQLGDAAKLCNLTGITTVADFRSADIALGGQGAPLAPAFHEWAFGGDEPIAVLNIGGIANLSLIDRQQPLRGFDTGPGNTLTDMWIRRHRDEAYDAGGEWARSGSVNEALLDGMLQDPYFRAEPPKSTGREYFNLAWVERQIGATGDSLRPEDVQATLTELTAASVAQALEGSQPGTTALYLCGGGVSNRKLVERLRARLPKLPIRSTEALGLDPDSVESAAFAWLAQQRVAGNPVQIDSVTGAKSATLLGAVHAPGNAANQMNSSTSS
jgi:anhydro-N-acetylmuramic acid kinase